MHRVQLIWVDERDEIIGYGSKLETHRLKQLHRAYSVFLYDSREHKMLLQKRASGKYHSGGLLSNACCSHPYKNENWGQAIRRGLNNELGISPTLSAAGDPARFLAKFQYYSDYGELSEHEMDNVFLFMPSQQMIKQIRPNPAEIDALEWMSFEEIDRLLMHFPELFTAWFPKAYEITKNALLMDGNRGDYIETKKV